MIELSSLVRDIPDYPKPGILFKDLTTLWKDPQGFKQCVDQLAEVYKDQKIDKVVGPESRGFLMGAPVAYLLNAGFVPIRKAGKLPSKTLSESYELEYGKATLEIHEDALLPGERVLIVDDLLATGGTAEAIVKLVCKLGTEVVGGAFVIELDSLKGREKLDMPITSLIHY